MENRMMSYETLRKVLITTISFMCIWALNAQQSFYVSPTGNDANPGTKEQPFKSVKKAQDAVRQVNSNMKGDITVYLRRGVYELAAPLQFDIKDSGTNGHYVIYKAYNDEIPVLSGGRKITGWKFDENGIWKAKLKRSDKLRQLYVNGKPAEMAKMKRAIKGMGKNNLPTTQITGKESWAFIPGNESNGIRFPFEDFPQVARPKDLEILNKTTWTSNRVCVEKLEKRGNTLVAYLGQPMFALSQRQGWGTALDPLGFVELYNAREFLDEPGEFYFDPSSQTLYYMPRSGEDMNQAEVIAPVLETLLTIQGKNLKQRVSNIRFSGITFAYTAWNMLKVGDSYGECSVQGCALTSKYGPWNWHDTAYQVTDLPASAVEVNSAKNIEFIKNVFELNASNGLNYENDVTHSEIVGNIFNYIGGCAINVGHMQHVYIGKQNSDNEGHGPYNIDNSNDKWDETVEGLCTDINIKNNVTRHTGFGRPANVVFSIFYGHNLTIEHNDIKHAPYTGISLGWGWEEWDGTNKRSMGKPSLSLRNNHIRYNKIGNVIETLKDGGAIYLLGMSQPPAKDPKKQTWSEVTNNYVYDLPVGWGKFGIHSDNGSRYFLYAQNVFNNVAATQVRVAEFARKGNFIIEQNYSNNKLHYTEGTTPVAPNTLIKDNNVDVKDNKWPEAAKKIMENAGLELEYKPLLNYFDKQMKEKGRKFEAETGRLLNRSIIEILPEASAGRHVIRIDFVGDGVEFANVPASSKIIIKYAKAWGPPTHTIYVNGKEAARPEYKSTGGWEKYGKKEIDIKIPEGATVKFAPQTGDGGIHIDYVEFKK